MFINKIKIKKKINIVIILSVILFMIIYCFQYIDYKKQESYINESDADYIYIESLNLKRMIKKSFDDDVINKGYIGMEIINNNIVLAGHALEQIFLKLYFIKLEDQIEIRLDNEITFYEVIDIINVDQYSFDIYNYIDKLILVTCDYNRNKRRIIVSKKLT